MSPVNPAGSRPIIVAQGNGASQPKPIIRPGYKKYTPPLALPEDHVCTLEGEHQGCEIKIKKQPGAGTYDIASYPVKKENNKPVSQLIVVTYFNNDGNPTEEEFKVLFNPDGKPKSIVVSSTDGKRNFTISDPKSIEAALKLLGVNSTA